MVLSLSLKVLSFQFTSSIFLGQVQDDAAPGRRLRDLANAVYNYVDVSHWSNQEVCEQARRIRLMCAAYGWDDAIALVNDFEADVQQALHNHE